jgi:S1-C subfamily serine protease
MDGGSFLFGDPPDDAEGPEPGGDPDAPLRGWLPPEDRLWRHPSELAASPSPARAGRSGVLTGRWAAVTAGVVGAAVVATVAVAVTGPRTTTGRHASTLAATETSLVGGPSAPASGVFSSTTAVAAAPDVTEIASAMRSSLVVIRPIGDTRTASGVILPGGRLVLSAAGVAGSAGQVDVVGADGRHHDGQVLGSDARAGVTVIRLADALVGAQFADEKVDPDEVAVTACLCSGATETAVAIGTVREVGTSAVEDGATSLVDAIEAAMPMAHMAKGAVLLDSRGVVIGILDQSKSSGADTVGYFVPSALAMGIAGELSQFHHVTRGWLGVVCSDASPGGALVADVLPASPAARAGLETGDVVEAVDDHVIGSLADLQARLYTAPPGTHLELTVLHDGAVQSVPVTVGTTPA